jgi:hypothetical protein
MGTWGQSREIFQSWDTGKGAVVPARKYNLSATPDGNVAVVFQDASDATLIDTLLGKDSVTPEQPLPLRYCSSIKTFCPDSCFASQRDKSCLSHVKPRFRAANNEMPAAAKPAKASPLGKGPAWPPAPTDDDNAWLFDEVLDPMCPEDDHEDSAFVTIDGLDEICQPICDLGKFQPKSLRSPEPPNLSGPSSSVSTPPTSPPGKLSSPPARKPKLADSSQKKALQALWNEGPADNLLNGLNDLLDSDMEPMDNPAHEFWAASLSDVMADPFMSHGSPAMKAKPKLGRPPLGSKPPGAKPKGAAPTTFKPFSKIHKEMHKMKAGQPMLHAPSTPKPNTTVKSKVVWKQTVTW